MSKSDKISVVVVAAREIDTNEPLYCGFDWAASRYETDPERIGEDQKIAWMEQFEIWMHPAMEKIIRFEIRSIADHKPFGKVQIDLGLLQPGLSDAWYQLSKLDGALPFKGQIRIRLNKVEDQIIPAPALSAVLPSLEASVAESVEAEYVASLTKEEREAFYNQKALKPAFRAEKNDSFDVEDDQIVVPTGKAIAVFWELKNMFPGMEDRHIYIAMSKNDNDMSKTMEYLQKKQQKQAREVLKHEYLDGGRLAEPPVIDRVQAAKNVDFMKVAAAGDLMDVPLFGGDAEGLADEGRRKALLIGCAYQQIGGDWDLKEGPLRDIRRVRNWLENVWGFANEEGRMMMMADDHPQDPCKPTANNILRALEWLGRDAKPGDSLFVYFSGHGGTANPSDNATSIEEHAAFEGPRPFWYGIDGVMVDLVDIYSTFLFKLPEACRVTFLIDCPNFHLWQPWYFVPTDLTLRGTSHPYYLPSDVQVFSSIGHPISKHGGRFTNTFLSLTSGAHVNSSYYELLHNLNKAMGIDAPEKLKNLTGTKMNYYTCSQRSDLRRPFDLNSYVPNCNRQIGPGPLDIQPVTTPNKQTDMSSIQFKLNIKKIDTEVPPPVVKVQMNDPGHFGISSPGKRPGRKVSQLSTPTADGSKPPSRRSSAFRDGFRELRTKHSKGTPK